MAQTAGAKEGGATVITTREVLGNLSDYLGRVAYSGERFEVTRHGKPMAALVSLDDLARLRKIEHEQE